MPRLVGSEEATQSAAEEITLLDVTEMHLARHGSYCLTGGRLRMNGTHTLELDLVLTQLRSIGVRSRQCALQVRDLPSAKTVG
jgi:hypothetical protein